jgi:myosin heavy subunit
MLTYADAQVHFEDNRSVLELLEGKPDGLMPILDDQCLVPSSFTCNLCFLAVC